MKTVFAIAVALLLAGCASLSPVGNPAVEITWKYAGEISYEKQAPGLGVSYKYQSSLGVIDQYVYDLGHRNWRDGVDDPYFAAHFTATIDEVKIGERMGVYRDIQVGPIEDVVIAGSTFRMVTFHLVRAGRPAESLTFLTARHGKLLKYRVSLYSPVPSDIHAIARKFIEDSIEAHQGDFLPGKVPGKEVNVI